MATDNDQLLGYVRRELRNHVAPEELRRDLRARQWPVAAIDDALRAAVAKELGGGDAMRQDYAADGFVMTGKQAPRPLEKRKAFSLGRVFVYASAALFVAAILLFAYARYRGASSRAAHAPLVGGAPVVMPLGAAE